MLTLSGTFTTHAAQETTDFCTLWRITRVDSTVFRFTDHDRDVVMSDGTYLAAGGYTASAARSIAGLQVDDMEVGALFDSAYITEADLQAGLWDNAVVEVFSAIWSAPSAGARMIRKGRIGQVRYRNGTFTAEMRGLMDLLSVNIGRVVSPSCDAILGDARCGVSLSAHTESGTVSAVTSRAVFSASDLSAETAGRFSGGLLTWTSGANDGYSMEVRVHGASGAFTLFEPMVRTVAVGDTFDVVAGCDKLFATCRDTFDNVANFRGFPHVPGNDLVLAPK